MHRNLEITYLLSLSIKSLKISNDKDWLEKIDDQNDQT